MIVSYHPCFEADMNIICAGRDPDAGDLSAIRSARAVVLPQGCREPLYRMARENCDHVFPDYDARFGYPGKTGQARLFAVTGTPHPQTVIYENTASYRQAGGPAKDMTLPLVFKLDWGGEGDTVALLHTQPDLERALCRAAAFERSGQSGFILQHYIPDSDRSLRVVVIGQTFHAYWRIQEQPHRFGTSVSHGATIDREADPALRLSGIELASRFCQRAGINLAGLDVIFAPATDAATTPQPLLLEVNYFFGRTGLGGSDAFYRLLEKEIRRWLADLDFNPSHPEV